MHGLVNVMESARNSKSSEILCLFWLPTNLKEVLIKNEDAIVFTIFSQL